MVCRQDPWGMEQGGSRMAGGVQYGGQGPQFLEEGKAALQGHSPGSCSVHFFSRGQETQRRVPPCPLQLHRLRRPLGPVGPWPLACWVPRCLHTGWAAAQTSQSPAWV